MAFALQARQSPNAWSSTQNYAVAPGAGARTISDIIPGNLLVSLPRGSYDSVLNEFFATKVLARVLIRR